MNRNNRPPKVIDAVDGSYTELNEGGIDPEYERELTKKESPWAKTGRIIGIVLCCISFLFMIYGCVQANRLYLNSKYCSDEDNSVILFSTVISLGVAMAFIYITAIPGILLLIKKKRMPSLIVSLIALPLLLTGLTFASHTFLAKSYIRDMDTAYNKGQTAYDSGDFKTAEEEFSKYPKYKDSEQKSFDSKVNYANTIIEGDNADLTALLYLQSLGDKVQTTNAYKALYENAVNKYNTEFNKADYDLEALKNLKETFEGFGTYGKASIYAKQIQVLIDTVENK